MTSTTSTTSTSSSSGLTGTIQVFTYKDGLLARLAHDLRLTLGRFEIQREGATVQARFWPGTLQVDGAIDRRGQLDPNALSDSDRRKVGENIAGDVLHLDRFPEASFRGQIVAGGAAVEGELTLAGRSAAVRVPVQVVADRLRAEVTLVPSRWGVAPFKALAGAIKLQDRVLVVLELQADSAGQTPEACSWTAG